MMQVFGVHLYMHANKRKKKKCCDDTHVRLFVISSTSRAYVDHVFLLDVLRTWNLDASNAKRGSSVCIYCVVVTVTNDLLKFNTLSSRPPTQGGPATCPGGARSPALFKPLAPLGPLTFSGFPCS